MANFGMLKWGVLFVGVIGLAACSSLPKANYNFSFGNESEEESTLNIADDRDAVLAAARAVIAEDPFMTLITVDKTDRPRARTVEHSAPDENMVIWIATIPTTRKLEQIRANPKVTLYFDGAGDTSYVSLMGRASIHKDLETINRVAWRSKEAQAAFWPNFPKNYVLIRVEPIWIEVVAPGIAAGKDNWRPQAVTFE